MRWDWKKALRDRCRGIGLRNAAEGVGAGLGAAIAIGAMEWFSFVAQYPLAIIPFATSIALVIGTPDAEPAQPRALVGGHVVATVVGLAVLKLTGPHAWAAAIAVGLAILAMVVTGTFHPPAGINPLLVVTNHLGWSYLLVPVLEHDPEKHALGLRPDGWIPVFRRDHAQTTRRGDAYSVCLCLAPLAAPPAFVAALAAALALTSCGGLAASPRSCRANPSSPGANTTLRS